MKVIEDKENPLLNRKEIKVIVEAVKNPSFDEAIKIICEHFKASEEQTVVREIKGKFGRKTFLISAFIYKSKEDKEKTESKKKGKQAEPAKKAETPEPTKPAQEKAEEKTQPTTVEKKEENK